MDFSQFQMMDILFKSRFALDDKTGLPISTAFTLTADGLGGIQWISPLGSLSTYGALISTTTLNNLPAYLESTTTNVNTLSTSISTINITINNILSSYSVFEPQVSGSQLVSTVTGLGNAGYISSAQFTPVSTAVSALGSNWGYTSTALSSLVAFSTTLQGQTASTFSTYTGITLVPALANLGTPANGVPGNAFVSTFTLIQYVSGASTFGYTTGTNLVSTVNGLGSAGYISTTQLTSTVNSLLSSVNSRITIENTLGNVIITNSQVNFSSSANIVYLSSLYLSSVNYLGTFASTGTVVNTADIRFSSLLFPLSSFAPYIISNSRMFIDYYPTFIFTRLSQNATSVPILQMTTTVVQGTSVAAVGNTRHTATLVPNLTASLSGSNGVFIDCYNMYTTPMRIQLDTAALSNTSTNISLLHVITNGYSIAGINPNALQNSTVVIRTATSNAVFFTLHNPPY
jgi:hypothetical protein